MGKLQESTNERALEEKLFELVLLLSLITGLFWLCYRVVFFKSIEILIVNSLSTLFFGLIYRIYKVKRALRSISLYYYFPILLLIALGYFPSGGATGSIIAIATTIYCTGLIIIRPRYFMFYAYFFTTLIFMLGALEYIFPELTDPFLNRRDEIRVSLISNTLMFATLGFCIFYFRKEYVFKEKRKDRYNKRLIREKNQIANSDKNKSIFLTAVWQEMIPSVSHMKQTLKTLKSTGLNAEQSVIIASLAKNQEFLDNLLTDLSHIAKSDDNNILLREKVFDLNAELRELIEVLEASPVHKGGIFTFRHSMRIPKLLTGDPVRIRQAIGSLLKNSFSHLKGKKVFIKTSLKNVRYDEYLIGFKLNYSGAGMSTQESALLFDSFYNHSDESAYDGHLSDPGMDIAKKLISAMGGTIQFSYDESGFNFHFDLPLKTPAPPEV